MSYATVGAQRKRSGGIGGVGPGKGLEVSERLPPAAKGTGVELVGGRQGAWKGAGREAWLERVRQTWAGCKSSSECQHLGNLLSAP